MSRYQVHFTEAAASLRDALESAIAGQLRRAVDILSWDAWAASTRAVIEDDPHLRRYEEAGLRVGYVTHGELVVVYELAGGA